mmetsp:Transcript_161112/g.309525  ORF Transcript_161112/g.309525 Transcript_161112/m.309525 type:complete len:105 (+) Transcript_161112:1-315(+)
MQIVALIGIIAWPTYVHVPDRNEQIIRKFSVEQLTCEKLIMHVHAIPIATRHILLEDMKHKIPVIRLHQFHSEHIAISLIFKAFGPPPELLAGHGCDFVQEIGH